MSRNPYQTRDENQLRLAIREDQISVAPANEVDIQIAVVNIGSGIFAFVTERDWNPEIYTMNQNGGAATNIPNNPGRDLDPALESNGNWLVFATDREGNLEIYVVKTQGGTSYNLTRNPDQDRDPDW